jgi:hypothetical protein
MAKRIPGTRQTPSGIPQEAHGGSDACGTHSKAGKDVNGPEAAAGDEILCSTGKLRQPELYPRGRA